MPSASLRTVLQLAVEHVLHKKDAQLEASQINTRWEPRLVDKCLKAKLPQRASKIRQGFNACDTSRTGMILGEKKRHCFRRKKACLSLRRRCTGIFLQAPTSR